MQRNVEALTYIVEYVKYLRVKWIKNQYDMAKVTMRIRVKLILYMQNVFTRSSKEKLSTISRFH